MLIPGQDFSVGVPEDDIKDYNQNTKSLCKPYSTVMGSYSLLHLHKMNMFQLSYDISIVTKILCKADFTVFHLKNMRIIKQTCKNKHNTPTTDTI